MFRQRIPIQVNDIVYIPFLGERYPLPALVNRLETPEMPVGRRKFLVVLLGINTSHVVDERIIIPHERYLPGHVIDACKEMQDYLGCYDEMSFAQDRNTAAVFRGGIFLHHEAKCSLNKLSVRSGFSLRSTILSELNTIASQPIIGSLLRNIDESFRQEMEALTSNDSRIFTSLKGYIPTRRHADGQETPPTNRVPTNTTQTSTRTTAPGLVMPTSQESIATTAQGLIATTAVRSVATTAVRSVATTAQGSESEKTPESKTETTPEPETETTPEPETETNPESELDSTSESATELIIRTTPESEITQGLIALVAQELETETSPESDTSPELESGEDDWLLSAFVQELEPSSIERTMESIARDPEREIDIELDIERESEITATTELSAFAQQAETVATPESETIPNQWLLRAIVQGSQATAIQRAVIEMGIEPGTEFLSGTDFEATPPPKTTAAQGLIAPIPQVPGTEISPVPGVSFSPEVQRNLPELIPLIEELPREPTPEPIPVIKKLARERTLEPIPLIKKSARERTPEPTLSKIKISPATPTKRKHSLEPTTPSTSRGQYPVRPTSKASPRSRQKSHSSRQTELGENFPHPQKMSSPSYTTQTQASKQEKKKGYPSSNESFHEPSSSPTLIIISSSEESEGKEDQ